MVATEATRDNRSTVLSRVTAPQGDEPWSGYDELTVHEIRAAVADDDERAEAVRSYERAHKNRAGVPRPLKLTRAPIAKEEAMKTPSPQAPTSAASLTRFREGAGEP